MSFQAQTQQQQPPPQVYPTTITNQPPSHHSNGSFGTVFVVLAVIVVISAIACFLGRLCNRRYQTHSQNHHHHNQNQKPAKQQNQNQNHSFRAPKEGGDVEFGFDNGIPTAKPNGHGGGPRGPKPPTNYGQDMKGSEMKIGDEGNLRAGA